MDNVNEHFESTEDEKIHQMLGGLKRIGVPGDFDFRVKGRIAAGRPPDAVGFRVPAAVKYAVSLVLLLLVGAYFGINALYSTSGKDVPPVAETKPALVPPTQKEITSPPSQNDVIEPSSNLKDERAGGKIPESVNSAPKSPVTTSAKSVNRKASPADKQPGGGSYEESLNSNTPRRPLGLNPGVRSNRPEDFSRNAQLPAGEVLSLIGVEGKYDGRGWKVDSVRKNSSAERSGLRAGDVVEAVNDRRLNERTGFESGFDGRTVRVVRDGRRIQIDLKP